MDRPVFVECAECRSKLGSPILCDSCINNRAAISELEQRLSVAESALEIFQTACPQILVAVSRILEAKYSKGGKP